MLARILAIVFPLFAIVLAGWLYGRARRPDMRFANEINMDVFVPALVFGALPPAVLNYVFAERYRREPDQVASIVMIGNVAALVFIPAALAIAL